MAKFIPIDKLKILREASAKGDDKAKKILRAQLDGIDFSADFDDYFRHKSEPATEIVEDSYKSSKEFIDNEPKSKLEIYLQDNEVSKNDPEYDSIVEEFYEQFPEERPHEAEIAHPEVKEEMDLTKDIAMGIIDLIQKCDATAISLMQNDDLDSTVAKGALTTIQEIKTSLLDGAEKIKKIKNSLCKNEEKELQ